LQRPEHREVVEAQHAPQSPRLGAAAASCILLGLAGSVLLTLTASRLADRRFHWWFRVVIDPHALEQTMFYIGTLALVAAWLGLRSFARSDRCPSWWMAAIGFVWSVPLLIGPPLFSHDLFSYLAQGTIAHLGLSPYHYPPTILAQHGYQHVLAGVDPFWRRATAPYGPLFVGVISLIVAATGTHVFAGVMLIRLFDLVGLVLLAVFVPRLARRLGSDPTRATWLAVASPLILLQLVAPGHNDLLMAGVMVAGVWLALERRPLLGIVVCTIAATIKLPALAAVAFIVVVWCREEMSWPAAIITVAKSAAAAVATAAIVTLVTGFGVGWISTSLFSTPGRVRLAITPATDLSFTIHKLLASVTFADAESVLRIALLLATVIIALVFLWKARWPTLPQYLGLTLLAFAFGGPALWPWYLAWGLVLLAAWMPAQGSLIVVAGLALASFVVKPDGILLLSRGSSPIVAAFWVLASVLGSVAWRRESRVQHRA
jgi:hypothetical protein